MNTILTNLFGHSLIGIWKGLRVDELIGGIRRFIRRWNKVGLSCNFSAIWNLYGK